MKTAFSVSRASKRRERFLRLVEGELVRHQPVERHAALADGAGDLGIFGDVGRYQEPIRVSRCGSACSLGRMVASRASPMKATLPSRRVASSAAFCAAWLPEQSTAARRPLAVGEAQDLRHHGSGVRAQHEVGADGERELPPRRQRVDVDHPRAARLGRHDAARAHRPSPKMATVVPPAAPSFFIAP
ncbi:MAG: hypothetical protein U1E53_31955 [Dongiaceae bacterium]